MNITGDKIKEFVERCYKEKDCNRHILMQQIANKLNGGYHSNAEAAILPHVFEYLKRNP